MHRRFDPNLDDAFFELAGLEKKDSETTAEAWARLHDQNSASKTRNFDRTYYYQEGLQSISAVLVLLLHLRYRPLISLMSSKLVDSQLF